MPPRARAVAKATAKPAHVEPDTSTREVGADPFATDAEMSAAQVDEIASEMRTGGPLDEDERLELEGYRALFAASDLAGPLDIGNVTPLTPTEGAFCRIHHPNGWPGIESGATCEHGTFWRWGAPSALELSGQTVMDPATDDWSDQDV